MNVFALVRYDDETGVSGTGVVAAGVQFPDGKVLMRWIVGEHRSSVTWDCIDDALAIHGHNGKTRLVQVAHLDLEELVSAA